MVPSLVRRVVCMHNACTLPPLSRTSNVVASTCLKRFSQPPTCIALVEGSLLSLHLDQLSGVRCVSKTEWLG